MNVQRKSKDEVKEGKKERNRPTDLDQQHNNIDPGQVIYKLVSQFNHVHVPKTLIVSILYIVLLYNTG